MSCLKECFRIMVWIKRKKGSVRQSLKSESCQFLLQRESGQKQQLKWVKQFISQTFDSLSSLIHFEWTFLSIPFPREIRPLSVTEMSKTPNIVILLSIVQFTIVFCVLLWSGNFVWFWFKFGQMLLLKELGLKAATKVGQQSKVQLRTNVDLVKHDHHKSIRKDWLNITTMIHQFVFQLLAAYIPFVFEWAAGIHYKMQRNNWKLNFKVFATLSWKEFGKRCFGCISLRVTNISDL